METKAFLRELCEECGGCSGMPISIEDLCSNPLEKYLYRMCKTESEAYFRGRRDGLMILGASVEQAQEGIISKARQPEAGNYYIEAGRKAGIQEVVDWVKEHSCREKCDPDTEAYFEAYKWVGEEEWQSQLKEWGLQENK